MAKEKRCNLFDDNGRPRRLKDGTRGCYRDASACRFVHPHEREWKTAHPSLPPRHEAVADSDSEFYYILLHSDRPRDHRDREREKERERDRDRDRISERERERQSKSSISDHPHRKNGTTTPPGPPPHMLTLDSPMDGGGTTKRVRSPSAISSSSDQLERLRKDRYRPQDLPPLRRDSALSTSHHSRSGSMDKIKGKERADLPTKTPPAVGLPIATPLSALPPEPSKTPPMQPPPPPSQVPEIPKLPSFASNQTSTSTAGAASRGLKEASMDEQRSAWHERIDLMFTSIASRRDYIKLESDLSQIRLLSDSSLFNNMREADRAHVNAQKMALEMQMATKRTEINETIQKLIGSGFWPVLRTPQISEMEKTLGEAKRHVLEVRTLLEDVKSSCTALFKTSASIGTQDSERPSKRRRLDGEADTPVQSASGNAEVKTETTTKELEEFRDKLVKLDGHLVDLQNDITQRDGIVSDEIELHVDSRLQEEDALYPPVTEPTEVSQVEIEAVVDAKNKELVRAVTVTGEEIGVLAVEVAELITKVNTLEARCRALEAENQEFKNKLAQDTLQHTKSQDDWLRRGKEVEAIAAALQAYISQTPAGQASDFPSVEYIIESLDSQLDGLFREKFSPKLGDIQQEVFGKVQETHDRTLDTVSPKIMLLLRMVNLIAARVGKPDIDAVNTA